MYLQLCSKFWYTYFHLHTLQIVSRNMTNLTPAQLEEFESTFRYFDKDTTNTLNLAEMIAALASLGIVYSEEDMDMIYDQLVSEYGAVTFEAFINLLVRLPLLQNGLRLTNVNIGRDHRRSNITRPATRGFPRNCERQAFSYGTRSTPGSSTSRSHWIFARSNAYIAEWGRRERVWLRAIYRWSIYIACTTLAYTDHTYIRDLLIVHSTGSIWAREEMPMFIQHVLLHQEEIKNNNARVLPKLSRCSINRTNTFL